MIWKTTPSRGMGNFKIKRADTVALKAIYNKLRWIWHEFFETSGALNDIKVVSAFFIERNISSKLYLSPLKCPTLTCVKTNSTIY